MNTTHTPLLSLLPDSVIPHIYECCLYGSQYVGGDAVTEDSDTDILVRGREKEITTLLQNEGFTDETKNSTYKNSGFVSFRKGDLNIVLATDAEWFQRAVVANELCRVFNLVEKDKRILLHDVVVRGLVPTSFPL